jgi:glutamyl-tRNA(Gln) amidotransferase subunit E
VHQKIDYDAVGLMVGLEVHQQLATDTKMFCHCPAGLYTRDHDGSVLRHMRPTLSELGEYDGTALMEFKTKKNIVYLLHKRNVCTYEMDDTPPFLVNPQAIDISIELSLMLGCDIVDEVHIARKQYLDGSIPTGFQRTAIVGVNGTVPFRGRDLSITQVSVEEDSCREISDRGHLVVWRTDRLGMPLIETVTGPDLRTPDEVEEAILLIGRICRSTGHVRVGLGASRQDVNVSVRGGRRVEIKGVPKASWARRLVHGEAWRQVGLLALRDELHRRGFRSAADVGVEHRDVTELFARCSLPFLRLEGWQRFVAEERRQPGFELGRGPFCVRAIRLPGLAGTLSWPTQPDHGFADELRGRVRVIAALDQQPILLHSDKWPDYEGSTADLKQLRRLLGCAPEDSVVVVWGCEDDTVTAADEVRIRYADATDGVPNETRQPFEDGSTDFERILPGPDRMYPDTDSPPQAITRARVRLLQSTLPEPPWLREQRWVEAGVAQSTVHYLIRRGGAALVDDVVAACGADPARACRFFGERLKALTRRGVEVDRVSRDGWRALFGLLRDRPVLWEVVDRLVGWLVAGGPDGLDRGVGREGLGSEPDGWGSRVGEIVAGCRPDHPDGSSGQRGRLAMGRAMAGLRGRVPGCDVAKAVAAALEGER